MNKPRIALIDGDILAYKASTKPSIIPNQSTVRQGFIATSKSYSRIEADELDQDEILLNLRSLLLEWVDGAKATGYKIVLSDPVRSRIFRHKIYNDYKANRKDVVRPRHLSACIDYLYTEMGAEWVIGLEGDDLLGLLSTYMSDNHETVVVSTDKDLRQLPGLFYNPDQKRLVRCSRTGNIKLYKSPSGKKLVGHGFKWFCAQMLMGDRVDNIVGLRGYGPVKVYSILKDLKRPRDMWLAVRREYDDVSHEHLNAQLLFILREHGKDVWCWIDDICDSYEENN